MGPHEVQHTWRLFKYLAGDRDTEFRLGRLLRPPTHDLHHGLPRQGTVNGVIP